jgi:hypothetical protein
MTTTLSSLPLPPSIQLKLAAAGFTSVGDFDGLSAAELAEDLVVEPREAQKLLAQVRSSLEVQPRDLKTKSALQLLNEERASNPITTFVKELDNLLGGGVALGQLTGARLCQGAGGGWRVAGGGWRVGCAVGCGVRGVRGVCGLCGVGGALGGAFYCTGSHDSRAPPSRARAARMRLTADRLPAPRQSSPACPGSARRSWGCSSQSTCTCPRPSGGWVGHTRLELQTGRQAPRQALFCYSHA